MSFPDYLEASQQRVNAALGVLLPLVDSEYAPQPTAEPSARLFEAMRYSLLNGGKRVRPVLVYASAEAVGEANAEALDRAACALECIHAYSLVHDDLPAMDDDDLRRGLPTCHRKFDEASAILAGDALQAAAFELLAGVPLPPATALRLVRELAAASGARGMVGGQAIDLGAVNRQLDLPALEAMHRLKTGALIRASARLGGLVAGASEAQLAALDRYAEAIGLAFQVQDDILDVESDTATLGKQQGADAARNKPTYPALLGMAEAKQLAAHLTEQAIAALSPFGGAAEPLRGLARFIVQRQY